MILAGRAAEKIALGMVSSGSDDDIRQATKLARAMVTRWGMSEEVGPMCARAKSTLFSAGRSHSLA